MFEEEEDFKYLEDDTHKLAHTKEKILKEYLKKNEKVSRNQTQLQKSHQKDKHLGSPPCKIK